MSADVIDLRPRSDQFLQAMREHGDWAKACEAAGVTSEDMNARCMADAKFDLSVVECHGEWIEETIMAQARAQIAKAREAHMTGYKARHPTGVGA